MNPLLSSWWRVVLVRQQQILNRNRFLLNLFIEYRLKMMKVSHGLKLGLFSETWFHFRRICYDSVSVVQQIKNFYSDHVINHINNQIPGVKIFVRMFNTLFTCYVNSRIAWNRFPTSLLVALKMDWKCFKTTNCLIWVLKFKKHIYIFESHTQFQWHQRSSQIFWRKSISKMPTKPYHHEIHNTHWQEKKK